MTGDNGVRVALVTVVSKDFHTDGQPRGLLDIRPAGPP